MPVNNGRLRFPHRSATKKGLPAFHERWMMKEVVGVVLCGPEIRENRLFASRQNEQKKAFETIKEDRFHDR
ncbi:MAG: hypothetical protein HQL76_00855 [Magnetococcales bacterium]|nr:hypothetical protein [Magnetococcales bacterium]